jgi:cell division transport system permease protein
MPLYLRKALQDIAANRFLNAVTVMTIALAVVITGAFGLFFINAGDLLDSWRRGIRLMVYLESDLTEARRLEIKYRLEQMAEVGQTRFVGRAQAMARLRGQMGPQASLLDGLEENPLPDAFEVDLQPEAVDADRVAALAGQIADLAGVEEVSYGRQWLERFGGLLALVRLAVYGLGGLFFLAALFFVANTIRLILYNRQEELTIMRLVGASERFIRTPFYLEALIQGAAGGTAGLGILYGIYLAAQANLSASLVGFGFAWRFLPWYSGLAVVAASMFIGWLGCFVSLRQFIKTA